MNKFLLAASLLFCVVPCAKASVALSMKSSGWGNATTASQNGMVWGMVVSSDGTSFSGATSTALSIALEGFTVPTPVGAGNNSTPVQIGTSNFYFAVAQTATSSSGPPSFTNGYMGTDAFNLTAAVNTSDPYGVLWFAEGTTTAGSHFGFQSLGTLPTDGTTITTGIGGTPGLATNTIGAAAAPEPSRLLLLGFASFGLLLHRRRQ